YGVPILPPAGLSPAGPICLSWTHNRTGRFPFIRLKLRTRVAYATPVQGHPPPGRTMPRGTKAWPTRGPASRPALHVTTGEPLPPPRCERPLGWRRPHQQGHCAPPTYLRRLLRWLAQGSRAPSPEGSLPGFPWGDIARRLNPCPPCYRAAF